MWIGLGTPSGKGVSDNGKRPYRRDDLFNRRVLYLWLPHRIEQMQGFAYLQRLFLKDLTPKAY